MSTSAKRILVGVSALGWLLTAIGWMAAGARTGAALIVAANLVLGIGLGGLVFVALVSLTRAGWSAAIRRVPEALAGALPLGAALTVLALARAPRLYAWFDPAHHDGILAGKSGWLDPSFFFLRAAFCLALWAWFATRFRRLARAPDDASAVAAHLRRVRLSAVFLICFALTYSMASFDWIMSLEAHWFSTVFAVYCFSGLLLAALAAVTGTAIVLARRGPLAGVLRPDHLHDLGKLMLGVSTFWAYIWFCQYMLIWYGNLPEETSYYVTRFHGAWGPLMYANVAVNWLIPFVVLLPRPAKRDPATMLWIAGLLLFGRIFDLFLLVQPALRDAPTIGAWEFAPLLAAVPLAVLVVERRFFSAPPVPRHDPHLVESLHYHN